MNQSTGDMLERAQAAYDQTWEREIARAICEPKLSNAELADITKLAHAASMRAMVDVIEADVRAQEPDGWAVTLSDKTSAPAGFWFAGIWNTRETAEAYLKKCGKGYKLEPMRFINPRE